jgi:hypothetical protein
MLQVPSCNCVMVHTASCVKLKHDICTLFITPGTEHGWGICTPDRESKAHRSCNRHDPYAPPSLQSCALLGHRAYSICSQYRSFLTPPACFLCNHLWTVSMGLMVVMVGKTPASAILTPFRPRTLKWLSTTAFLSLVRLPIFVVPAG